MKTWILLFGGAILLLISGCEFESYKDYQTPAYEGIFTWTQVTKKAEWHNRWDHTSVSFDNRIWVMGGYNPGSTCRVAWNLSTIFLNNILAGCLVR